MMSKVETAHWSDLRLVDYIDCRTFLPDHTKPFIVRDNFVINTKDDAEVKIAFMEEEFRLRFLGNGVFSCHRDRVLFVFSPCNSATDKQLLHDLENDFGIDYFGAMDLRLIYYLMKKHSEIKIKAFVEKKHHVFYGLDTSGKMSSISLFLEDDVWSIYYQEDLDYPQIKKPEDIPQWSSGNRIFAATFLDTESARR